MTRTPQDFAAFLESLKVKNEGPEEMHGWRFDDNIEKIRDSEPMNDVTGMNTYLFRANLINYLLERLRRAESNPKPETLVEDVKAYMREIVRAYELNQYFHNEETMQTWQEFRKLCEPGDK